MIPLRAADIRVLYVRELRSALRERAVVVNSILLPILLYPFLLWLAYTGIAFVSGQTRGFSSRVMLQGLPEGHRLRIELARDRRIELQTTPDPAAAIRDGTLDALAEVTVADASGAPPPESLRARLTFDESKDRSRQARNRLRQHFAAHRDRVLEAGAATRGVTRSEFQRFGVESHNVASSRQMGRFLLGVILPVFLIVMLAIGAVHPAVDATAGEREKSTWETLLTTGTGRANVVVAKYLYVSTMAAVAGLLNLLAMLVSMRAALAPVMRERIEDFSFQLPLASVPLIVLLTLLLALLVAAGMMILASFARTYKEGQSMVGLLYGLVVLPTLLLGNPALELTPVLAAVPVVNVAMVFREAIAGVYRWPLIALTVAVELGAVALALALAAAVLHLEDVVIGSYPGTLGRFLKERILRARRRSAPA